MDIGLFKFPPMFRQPVGDRLARGYVHVNRLAGELVLDLEPVAPGGGDEANRVVVDEGGWGGQDH